MDLSAWLQDLGLERYADAFAANDVDAEILPQLTAEDLIAIGVASVGHRRKLLEAIAALQASDRAATAALPTPPRDAERRQLTVLFCDLVGSTELSAGLDPEDLSAVISRYHNAVTREVGRFEGHVAKFMGDGVLAYFGWPQAHEDDAERAVRAGLALVQRIGGLVAAGRPLAVRIGIATGLVVVGELVGEGEAQERAVVGETPNLAARLQALAEPGSIVISQATRRLVGGLFDLTDLGPQRLKGFAETLAAFWVEGEGPAEGRFEALHGERLTPLVGREHELGILLGRWTWAKEGDGQVVLLSGEAGIGKSRLIRALREQLAGEPHLALNHFCSPYHTNSALHPIIAQLECAAGFAPADQAGDKLAKLEALLGQATTQLDEVVPLIGGLLGVPFDGRYATLNLSPQLQKQRTFEVLLDQLAGLARARPLIDLYEDLHWVDPSTLEFLDLLVERVRGLPALVVLTYRPEFNPPWTGRAHVTALTVNRLGRRQGAFLVDRLTGGKALPDEILDQILAKTDGVPLFVEELTKTVLESGLLTNAGHHYQLSGPLPPLAIPGTLHDSLMARLDRLGPVKEVAQTAAVIGREFAHDLLSAVSTLSESQLHTTLDRLVQSELILRRATPPPARYSFKHALVQDAAYQSLLKSHRQQLHARIAKALEERFPNVGGTQPEIPAHHLTEAGLLEQAIHYWEKAGLHAIARFANAEATGHLTKALELFAALAETKRRDPQELRLRIALIVPLIALRGFGSIEVEDCAHRAKEISERSGDTEHRFAAVRAVWNSSLLRRPVPNTLTLTVELLRLAEASRDPAQLAVAHRSRGYSLFVAGQLERAQHHLAQGIELADSIGDAARFGIYGEHPAMVCRIYAAQVLTILGEIGRAATLADEAIDVALRLANPHTLVWALAVAAHLGSQRRDDEVVRARAGAAVELAREHGLPQWLAMSIFCHGWSLSEMGNLEAGILEMEHGQALWRETGAVLHMTFQHGLLAIARCAAGDMDHGRADLAAAFAHLERFGERYVEAELHRIEALFQRREGTPATNVEAALRRAIAIAESQGARLWQLRAATDLARLWADEGERRRARDLLAPVYDWFTEGFETADLKDAKALLDELR